MTNPAPLTPTLTPAKRAPDGFLVQRMPVDLNGRHGQWLATRLNAHGRVDLQVYTDAEVADWAPVFDEFRSDTHVTDIPGYIAGVRTEIDRLGGDLPTAVGFIVGAASSCWANLAGAGVFESERASALVDLLLELVTASASPPGPSPS